MHGSTTGGDEQPPAETDEAERFEEKRTKKKTQACVIVGNNNMWELQVCTSDQTKKRKSSENVIGQSDLNQCWKLIIAREMSDLPTSSVNSGICEMNQQ